MAIRRSIKMMLCVAAVLGLCPPLHAAAQGTGLITFDHYHTLDEIQDYLETVTARHSDLATLLAIEFGFTFVLMLALILYAIAAYLLRN